MLEILKAPLLFNSLVEFHKSYSLLLEFPFLCSFLENLHLDAKRLSSVDDILYGFEIEFYLEGRNNSIEACYKEIDALSMREDTNIPNFSFKSELGQNQYEVVIYPHKSPLKACDCLVITMGLISEICNKHNVYVNLSSMPLNNNPGSSCQLSVSFLNQGELLNKSSVQVKKSIASLLSNTVSLSGLYLQSEEAFLRISSYNILSKFKNSPSIVSWGFENRTNAIRVCKAYSIGTPFNNFTKSFGDRIEYRVPSASSNPYFIMLGVLLCLCEGQKWAYDLEAPCYIDPSMIENSYSKIPDSFSKAKDEFISSRWSLNLRRLIETYNSFFYSKNKALA